MQKAIDLYFLRLSPPSRGVLMTLKHLNLGVNVIEVDLRNGKHLTQEYTKINPLQKVPAIHDNGFFHFESRAIMQYLCNKYAPNGSLYPSDIQKRAVVDRLLYWDTFYYQSLREALLLKVIRDIDPTPFQMANYRNTMRLMESMIAGNRYVAGNDLTIADISLLATTTVSYINDFQDVNQLPNLKAWYERLKKELPYYDEVNGEVSKLFKELMDSKKSFYHFNKEGFIQK